jgi:hypothetical protein
MGAVGVASSGVRLDGAQFPLKGYPEVGHHGILGFRRQRGEDLTLTILWSARFFQRPRGRTSRVPDLGA